MFRRRVLLWSAAACSLGSLVLFAVYCQGPPRVRVGADWTPERLVEGLTQSGEWESRDTPNGVLLKRVSTTATWDDLVEQSFSRHSLKRHEGVLLVYRLPDRAAVGPAAELAGNVDDGNLQLGMLGVYGHPAELRRLLERFVP